jgi:uncharacterized phage protein gp47/JayE
MSEPCGCCAGIEAVTPVALVNRPGLGAIAYRVGTHATFLETMLARLTTLGVKLGSDEIASWLLSPPDLIEPRSLARKLQTSSDPLSAYLRERLSSGARRVLDPYDGRGAPPPALETAIVDDLNHLLQATSLYEPARFADVALPGELWGLIAQDLQGADLVRLNRRLLEAAYPRELARRDVIHPLHRLTTRAPSDPAIALLDAWATVADVLTFYQERIANEGYLRTTAERRSVLELARLVGYRLRPGVAASVYLAFTVADGFTGDLPAGVRAQSIPGAGELPQFFETSVPLTARDAWNRLSPRLTRPQLITLAADSGTDAATRGTLYFQGIATNLKTGDVLVIALGDDPRARPVQQALRVAATVDPQGEHGRTEVTLAPPSLPPASVGALRDLLERHIQESSSIFGGSRLAGQVAETLHEVIIAVAADAHPQTAAAVLVGVQPRLQGVLAVAARRQLTRLQPWIRRLMDELLALQSALSRMEDDAAPPVGVTPPSLGPTSPLGNLGGLLDSIARPPSLQPSDPTRLARVATRTFAPQSDMAPRLLARLRPAAGPLLYSAWANAEVPVSQVHVYAARVRAGLFASTFAGAPTTTAGVVVTGNQRRTVSTTTFAAPTLANAWNGSGGNGLIDEANTTAAVALDSTYDQIKPGTWVAIDRPPAPIQGAPLGRAVTFHRVIAARTVSMTTAGFSAKVTQLTVDPPWLSDVTDAEQRRQLVNQPQVLRGTVVHAQTEKLELAEEPLDADLDGDAIELDRVYDGLEAGRWIIVSGDRTDIPGAVGVRSAELVMVSGVTQGTRTALCAAFPAGSIPFSIVHYTTPANTQGDRLLVGTLAVGLAGLTPARFPNQRYCDQVELGPGIFADAYVPSGAELGGDFSAFAGLLVDPVTGRPFPNGRIGPPERASLWAWRISSEKFHTTVALATPLAYAYEARTISIYGNVVNATHGQTVAEVLGHGDGAQALQTFALHQKPLTHTSAPTSEGAESTLVARVNDVKWREEHTLVGRTPTDRVYVTQTDDADRTSLTFGTGEHGARLPTGAANVQAEYRYGIGKAGNVKARQISQLATRPLGAQEVVNPLPATGGADRDSRDQARRNAPVAVLALDRLVSTEDHADFARTFAGIGKATAARLSDGRRQVVHVTIAGVDDIPIDVNSDLYRNLVQALHRFGDPHQPIQVALRRLKLLVVSAGVQVQPDYRWESVEPRIRRALLDALGFDRRELGQSGFPSEVISIIQAVEGVAYVDLRIFDAVPEHITVEELAQLAASLALRSSVEAELARIDPAATGPTRPILPAELAILTPDIPDTLLLTEIGR